MTYAPEPGDYERPDPDDEAAYSDEPITPRYSTARSQWGHIYSGRQWHYFFVSSENLRLTLTTDDPS